MDSKLEKFFEELNSSINAKNYFEEESGVVWIKTDAKNLPSLSEKLIGKKALFDCGFITTLEKDLFRSSYIFRLPEFSIYAVIYAEAKEFVAVSSTLNVAIWDERKMQDLSGLKFENIPDNRPILFHPDGGLEGMEGQKKKYPKNANYIYQMPMTGAEGEFQIPVGPVHAGIIEPGHFRFSVVGEGINKLETRMFYLHRGVETLVETRGIIEAIPLIESISGDERIANMIAYCNAIEKALEIKVPERAQAIRVILAELERIYSHLSDLGGMPTDVGFYFAASRFAVLREDMMRINKELTDHRFLGGVIIPGGIKTDMDKVKLDTLINDLHKFMENLNELEKITLTNSTYLDRVYSTGIVTPEVAERLFLVGPVARAAGYSCDLRKYFPYEFYEKVKFTEQKEEGGDVLCRFLVKLSEVKHSVEIIRAVIAKIPSGSVLAPIPLTRARRSVWTLGWSEAPRGACTFMIELDENQKIKKFRCKTASFRNWRGAENLVPGNIVPDFPLINKSFNMSYAGTDL